MSGPIVRKYGFPNFEKIFGSRPVLHGAEDESAENKDENKASPTAASKAENRDDASASSDRPDASSSS